MWYFLYLFGFVNNGIVSYIKKSIYVFQFPYPCGLLTDINPVHFLYNAPRALTFLIDVKYVIVQRSKYLNGIILLLFYLGSLHVYRSFADSGRFPSNKDTRDW